MKKQKSALHKTVLASTIVIPLLIGSAVSPQAAEQLKLTTPIPPGIAMPDTVETRLGTLNFFDGFPDQPTVEKIYDNLDFQRAVQAYLLALAPVNMAGQGSQYAVGIVDSKGKGLDGGKNYRLHVEPNMPVKDFWSAIVYDNQTRSMLQTDQDFPQVSSLDKGLVANADGSVDVFFGPKAPVGMEKNWIQTIPGKGWNMLFRLYGPLEPWFDKTWRLGEIEAVE